MSKLRSVFKSASFINIFNKKKSEVGETFHVYYGGSESYDDNTEVSYDLHERCQFVFNQFSQPYGEVSAIKYKDLKHVLASLNYVLTNREIKNIIKKTKLEHYDRINFNEFWSIIQKYLNPGYSDEGLLSRVTDWVKDSFDGNIDRMFTFDQMLR